MTGFSKEVRELVRHRAGGVCERCGQASPAYQFHHRRPRGLGGSRRPDTNQPANSIFVCVPCHCAIEADRRLALDNGWLVRQGMNPASVPVYRMGRWVTLNNEGGYETKGNHGTDQTIEI